MRKDDSRMANKLNFRFHEQVQCYYILIEINTRLPLVSKIHQNSMHFWIKPTYFLGMISGRLYTRDMQHGMVKKMHSLLSRWTLSNTSFVTAIGVDWLRTDAESQTVQLLGFADQPTNLCPRPPVKCTAMATSENPQVASASAAGWLEITVGVYGTAWAYLNRLTWRCLQLNGTFQKEEPASK